MATSQDTQPLRGTSEHDTNLVSLEANFQAFQRSFSFLAIIIGRGVTLRVAALENTVLTTAMPVLLTDIPLDDNWPWLTNAFFLGSAAFQPLLGQLANLWGRRWTTMSVIALFTLGSGVLLDERLKGLVREEYYRLMLRSVYLLPDLLDC